MSTNLSNVNSGLLPNEVVGPIFSKATEESAVMRLCRKVPLSMSANTAIPVTMDVPTAGWVSEAGVKPVSEVGVGIKIMTGKKLALLIPISKEVAMTNPVGVVDQMQADLPTAMARAFDQAAINGKDMRTGGAGPFTEYLSLSKNTVALGTASQGTGGLYTDIVTGAGKVVDRNYDFTGIAADPRFKIDALLQTDTQGRPLFVDTVNGGAGAVTASGTLAGFPTAFSKGVSGKYWRAGDQTQTVTLVGTPTGGTFVLSSGGNSATLAYNAATSAVQTAVRAWGGLYAAVTVTGSAGAYTIAFPDTNSVKQPAAPFAVDQRLLTGGTAAASQAAIAATGTGGTDTLLRGIGGDWSQCAYGTGMEITFEKSTEASYYDGSTWHSAFQENLVLYLVEAYFGFVVGDLAAFVSYTKGSATF